MGGYYMQYLESLCRRRGWTDPAYECSREHAGGFTCLVLVNGREYQTDLAYESHLLARENAAMRAFMVCQNFSANGGMLVRNGVVQGIPSASAAAAAAAQDNGVGGGGGGFGRRRKSGRQHHQLPPSFREASHHSVGAAGGVGVVGGRRSGHHSSSSSTASIE